jgi:hypothetical protein
MKLLITLKHHKNHLLFVNTVKGNSKFISLLPKDTLFSRGIAFSGSDLVISFRRKDKKKDFLFVKNSITKNTEIFQCTNCEFINSIISIFPGKLFVDSAGTRTIESIDYDPVNFSTFKDDIHYTIGKDQCPVKLNCLYAYRHMWYISCFEKKRIYDLSNERVVFSGIEDPNNIFFNSQDRLCFLESGHSLFHCGDDIFHLDPNCYFRGVIEDPYDGGYWIAFVEKDTSSSGILFIDYDGNIDNVIPFPDKVDEIYNIVAARGTWSTEV